MFEEVLDVLPVVSKLRGNVNRIKELDELGLRPDAIAKTFQENGINITEATVNVVLNGEIDNLNKKALPKKVVQSIRHEKRVIENAIIA